MVYNLKLESEIKKLGFKKRWLQDRSGYWFVMKKNYKDLKLKFYIESDRNIFSMSIKVYDESVTRLTNGLYEPVKLFKCDIKTIKEVTKRYK